MSYITEEDKELLDLDFRSIAIYGPTGIGKTKNSVKIVESLGLNYRLIRHIEELTLIQKELQMNLIEVLIFDDIDWSLSKPEKLIHLTDPYYHCSFRLLRNIIRLQPNIVKIFTHNNISAWRPVLATNEQWKAILRRLKIVQVETPRKATETLRDFFRQLNLTKQFDTQS